MLAFDDGDVTGYDDEGLMNGLKSFALPWLYLRGSKNVEEGMLPYVTDLVYISQMQNSYKSCIPTHKDHFLLHPPTFLILVAATYAHSSHVPPGPG